ncbi:MAG: hypothetical protein WC901_06040 [Candidatus Margulisiibacteriota bacterium]
MWIILFDDDDNLAEPVFFKVIGNIGNALCYTNHMNINARLAWLT